jgi:hypothetical protein
MTVVGGPFLLAIGRADAGIHGRVLSIHPSGPRPKTTSVLPRLPNARQRLVLHSRWEAPIRGPRLGLTVFPLGPLGLGPVRGPFHPFRKFCVRVAKCFHRRRT